MSIFSRFLEDIASGVSGALEGIGEIASGAGQQLHRAGSFFTGPVGDALRLYGSDLFSSDTLLLGPMAGPAKRGYDRQMGMQAKKAQTEEMKKQAAIAQRRKEQEATRFVNLEAESRKGFLGARSLLNPAGGNNTLLTSR